MKSFNLGRIASGALLVLVGSSLLMAAADEYHLLKKYTFGAAEGSTREYFDYITVDSAARRVYLSHGTEIKVIDADSGALIGNVTGLKQDSRRRGSKRVWPRVHQRRSARQSNHFRFEDPQGDRRSRCRQGRGLRHLRSISRSAFS